MARRITEKCILRQDDGLLQGPGEKETPGVLRERLRGSLGLEVGNIIQRFSRFEGPHSR